MKRLLIIKKIQCGYIAIILLAMNVIFTGCLKEKRLLRDNTWSVRGIETDANSVLNEYPRPMPITLSIIEMINESDKFFVKFNPPSLALYGKVKIRNNKIDFHDIQISPEWAGGNHQFRKSFADLLGEINRYKTDGAILTLTSKKGDKIELMREEYD